jgi:hypothetical protein
LAFPLERISAMRLAAFCFSQTIRVLIGRVA